MTKFLFDANLSRRLVRHVREAGYDCVHMRDFLPAEASDLDVAGLANTLEAVLVTKDADFLDLAQRGILRGPQVRVRTGNLSDRETALLLVPAIPQVVAALASGERIVEVR